MNKQELRERRRAILDAMLLELSPSNVMIETEADEWLDALDSLDREYAASREMPVYPLVRDMERLTSALLAVANTPSALAGVCRTIESACATFRATLDIDATIAEFQAADEMDFKSSEDVNG